MILFFYNLALLAALIAGAPWWLWRMATTQKYREGLLERLGLMQPGLIRRSGFHSEGEKRPLIWVHAVSVGEVLAVSRLVKALDAALPEYLIAISTTTRTGQALARERFGAHRVFYCPLDLPWAIRATLNALEPRLLILVETEFWPNLLSSCFCRKIPVAVVNARISDRSWPRYRRLSWLWKPFLRPLSRVLAQSQTDADRLQAIGCCPERVSVAGNLKFDVRAADEAEATRFLKALAPGLRFIVAGSTLEGEESALLEAWPRLLKADPRLAMVLAPRHPERFGAVAALLEKSSFPWVRRSAWRSSSEDSLQPLNPGGILLLDTIGELASIYSLASVAFVGGSLIPAGGHNPLEPAQFGVPIVMGPYYANFRAITEDLLSHQAVRISAKEDLAAILADLLEDSAAKAMGDRARQVFDQQSGATGRCVEALKKLLSQAAKKGLIAGETAEKRPSVAKACVDSKLLMARLKSCPFKATDFSAACSTPAKMEPRFFARRLLVPLIPFYRLGLAFRELRLVVGLEPVRRLRFPVVSIGNLATGGAGKTPLAIALAGALQRRGLRVDVLSRGYGRESQLAVRVNPEGTAAEFGDEPLLIARETGVPVYVAPQRYDAGLLAEAEAQQATGEDSSPLVHLLDDGFQHRQLARDVNILLLNLRDWQDKLLPAGNLREPLVAARRASVIAIPANEPELEGELRAFGWQGPVWRLRRKMEISGVHGPVAAFCGIARPEQFFAGLEAAGLTLTLRRAFADHCPYTRDALERLLAEAREKGATAIVTTEKDLVRIGKLATVFSESMPLVAARLHVEIENEGAVIDWLVDRIMHRPHQPSL